MDKDIRPHYFDLENAPYTDAKLAMAKDQGYVPRTCLLGGDLVIALVFEAKDPCKGCACPREKCKGR